MDLHSGLMTRILWAPAGTDNHVNELSDVLLQDPVLPWRDLGLSREDPVLLSDPQGYPLISYQVCGGVSELEQLELFKVIAIALLQAHPDAKVTGNVLPVSWWSYRLQFNGNGFAGQMMFMIHSRAHRRIEAQL